MKKNFYCYEKRDSIAKGMFNIYQAKSGGIFLNMGNNFTLLSQKQINDLGIHLYDLIDFNIDEFNSYYDSRTWTPLTAIEKRLF